MEKKVELIYYSPLWLIANGTRYSHDNHYLSDSCKITDDKNKCTCFMCGHAPLERGAGMVVCPNCSHSDEGEYHIGKKDFDLIKRVGLKMKHESVLEHSIIVYHIECSRAVLQELARHRHVSLTVKSTRYTLKELKNEKSFYLESDWRCQDTEIGKRAAKYLVYTGIDRVDHDSILALERLRDSINVGVSNDFAKYSLPEAFKTQLQLSLNLRELIHVLRLRISKDALWEFRHIAFEMFNVLPFDYKDLILADKDLNEKINKYIEEFKK